MNGSEVPAVFGLLRRLDHGPLKDEQAIGGILLPFTVKFCSLWMAFRFVMDCSSGSFATQVQL